MQKYVVKRSGRTPLAFEGEVLASFATSFDRAHPDYSGRPGEAEGVTVYRTKGGKYVVAVAHLTCWQGQHNRYDARVFDSLPGALNYLAFEAGVPEWVVDEIADQLGAEAVAEEVA